MRTPCFIGNWKMHKDREQVRAFFSALESESEETDSWRGRADVAVAPQSIHLAIALEQSQRSGVWVVAQHSGQAQEGAHTGEVSPAALKDLGVDQVLVGHSERRWVYHEPQDLVVARFRAALEAGLRVVLCVGERLVERKEGRELLVVEEQLGACLQGLPCERLSRVSIAYEPVWAIGTGETATSDQAQGMHAFIRQWVHDRFSEHAAQHMHILYGGSVKPANAEALMAQKDVDGLLVGGASLDPLAFAEIVSNGLRSADKEVVE